MTNINITNFRKDIYVILKQTIEYNETVNITTKYGNAVLLSEQDYNNIIETLYISSIPDLKNKILEGMMEPLNECIEENEVEL